jgi:hypothetical protein
MHSPRGHPRSDIPAHADEHSFTVQAGDLIALATDGVRPMGCRPGIQRRGWAGGRVLDVLTGR